MARKNAGGKHFKPLHMAKASNVPLLGRTRWMGHLQKAATRTVGGTKFQRMTDFLSSRAWTWGTDYLKGMFAGRYKPYPTYALDGKAGVYAARGSDGAPVRLSIVGDWGTGTQEAWKVAQSIAHFHPEYTVHLGDVYFVGDEQDVMENFLGEGQGNFTPVAFPKGSVGTFALIGNHEMYVGGGTYFTKMLPYCQTGRGMRSRRRSFAWKRSTGGSSGSIRATTRSASRCWAPSRMSTRSTGSGRTARCSRSCWTGCASTCARRSAGSRPCC